MWFVADEREVVAIRVIGSFAAAVVAVLLMSGCAGSRAEKAVQVRVPEVRPQNAEITRPASPQTESSTPEVQQLAATTPVNSEAARMPAGPSPTVAELVAKAESFYARTPNYTCRITRQERLGNTLQPTEKLLLNFRAQPRSVYYRWLGDVCAGRECVWVDGANDGKIVSKGGKSDFGMTGRRIAVSPDSFLAKSRSRYSIHESGQDVLIKKLRDRLDDCDRGVRQPDSLKYVGIEQPADLSTPMHHVVETIPAGTPLFAKGGVRDWYFDTDTGRIVVAEAKDPSGERQEYYYFEHLFANNTLTAADFEPDIMFAKPAKAPDAAAADPPN